MKKITFLLFALAIAAMAQNPQVLPEHSAGAGYFSTPFYVQWYDTTFAVYDDTLACTGPLSVSSKPFRAWPYMAGDLFLTGADSVAIRSIELWTSALLDTTNFIKSKVLFFSPKASTTTDSSMSASGTYGCDFSTGGAWHPTKNAMLKVRYATGQQVLAGNTLRFRIQGWGQ